MNVFFEKAVPVWVTGREKEMNLRVQFKAVFGKGKSITAKIATSGIYQMSVNGKFVCYGPARAGRGFFRVDEIDLTPFADREQNTVIIEVCGYNARSYYLIKQDSFLTAELLTNGQVAAYTGNDFTARINPEYIKKIQRYSFQRPFAESYRVIAGDTYFTDAVQGTEPLSCLPQPNYLKRNTPYPMYEKTGAKRILGGSFSFAERESYWRNGAFDALVAKPEQSEYLFENPDLMITEECEKLQLSTPASNEDKALSDGTYGIYELPYNATGMIGIHIKSQRPIRLYIMFDEILSNAGRVDYLRGTCCNAAIFDLPAGDRTLRFFEVYTCKYLQAAVYGGDAEAELFMTEYKHPPLKYTPKFGNAEICKIADAAVETFRQGSVDLFMDCPSRERAGWLCDSFFSGRTEYLLCGETSVEHDFLENFLCEENYVNIPDGMIPMCYPADHTLNSFIPNWAMWLFLELREYLDRSGDRKLVERFRAKAYGLLKYFSRFENSDGLLENLESWVFVEWSRANDLTGGVNYPSNMLYAAMLSAISELYNLPELSEKAQKIRETVYRQSFDGEFFRDHAVRKNGILKAAADRTEVCQYYAFFFGVATPERDGKLLETLIHKFGPERNSNTEYPEIAPANAFIGNYLRLEILMRAGFKEDVLKNIVGFFGYMANRTGTLWENTDTSASCDHCFASYVICWLEKLKNII